MQVSPWVSATRTVYPAALAALIWWNLAVAFIAATTSAVLSDLAATGTTKSVRARIAKPTSSGHRRPDLRVMEPVIVMFPFFLPARRRWAQRRRARNGLRRGVDRAEVQRGLSLRDSRRLSPGEPYGCLVRIDDG